VPGDKVIVVHNQYQQPGGEDEVFRGESLLLEQHGHQVIRYSLVNSAIATMPRLTVATKAVWNPVTRRELERLFRREQPRVVHFHNTFPLVSPSAYYAARSAGIPVVQTLHNYRLVCPGATFYRNGRVCEDCLGKWVPWPSIVHGCYRHDRAATTIVAGMVTVHRGVGTWANLVDCYIALSDFASRKFVDGGIPPSRIVVKPNFLVSDPGIGAHDRPFALYVGRLSSEKGLATLLEAWRRFARPAGFTLKIVGTGPLANSAVDDDSIEWLGWQSKPGVLSLMHDAAFLVAPSACYENFPMAILEAFATALPVVATNHGAMAEIVAHDETGLLFEPGDVDALAAALQKACAEPTRMREFGAAGRRQFEAKYTAAANYATLMGIYDAARGRAA
jgi:glycosyltransferase involved in cell wall biosynthesis